MDQDGYSLIMTIRGNLILSVVLLFATLSSAFAIETLEDAKRTYQAEHLEIDQSFQLEQKELLAKYASALASVRLEYQKEGNLDTVVLVKKEEDAAADGTLGDFEADEAPRKVVDLRRVAESQIEKIHAGRKARVERLNQQYIRLLDSLKASLTKQGKVDEAVAVLEEIRRVGASAEKEEKSSALTMEDLPEELQKSLVLWVPFEKEEGDAISDISDSRNKGIAEGSALLEKGRIGSARSFRGDTDRIVLQDTLPDSKRFTIAVWVSVDPTAGGVSVFSDFDGRNANDLMFSLQARDRIHIRADKNGEKLNTVIQLAEPLSDAWHHLVWVHDSRNSFLYFDGEQVASYEGRGSNEGFHRAFIGYGNHGGAWSNFKGDLDEFMFWKRDLEEEEVKELFQLYNY